METKWKSIQWRVYVFYSFFLLAGIAITAKIIYTQSLKGEIAKINEKLKTTKVFTVYSYRGSICACDGTPLAVSNPRYNIYMDFGNVIKDEKERKKLDNLFWTKLDSIALRLNEITGQRSENEFLKILRGGKERKMRYVPLVKNIDFDQLKQVREVPFLKLGKFKGGLIEERVDVRERPFGNLALRTIGYFREDSLLIKDSGYRKNTRAVGLESWFNTQLTGSEGKQFYRRFSTSQLMPVENEENIPPENGSDVITTLDIYLQDVAETALRNQLVKSNAFQGTAVLMEVQTGEIKAIVNLQYNKGEYKEIYNYAINEGIEPGSTFKTASLLVALDDGCLKLTDSVYVGNGEKKFYNATMRDSHPPKKAYMTLTEAFRESSNVGISSFIYNKYSSHPSDFIKGLHDFGLNSKTGIELKGESIPYIKTPQNKSWSAVSLPWISVGYELRIAPVQTLAFYNAIANNGIWVKPHLVREIRLSGIPVEKFDNNASKKPICSAKATKEIQYLLSEVVENGTARLLKNDKYKVAGKTGTAKISAGKGMYTNSYNSSFVGYFPADNPRYSCIVIVNNPKGVYYGSVVAAPVFKEIADYVYATRLAPESKTDSLFLQIPGIIASNGYSEDYETLFKTTKIPYIGSKKETGWVTVNKQNNVCCINPVSFTPGQMPDLQGMGAKDALFCLEKMGVNVMLEGKGYVFEQSILPGEKLGANETVVLKLTTRM